MKKRRRERTGGAEEEEWRDKGEDPLGLYDTNVRNLLFSYGLRKRIERESGDFVFMEEGRRESTGGVEEEEWRGRGFITKAPQEAFPFRLGLQGLYDYIVHLQPRLGRAQPGRAGITSWPRGGPNWHFHPQPTGSCPPDPPRACCQALVVGMWKCSPPQSQHSNRGPFPARGRRKDSNPCAFHARGLRPIALTTELRKPSFFL